MHDEHVSSNKVAVSYETDNIYVHPMKNETGGPIIYKLVFIHCTTISKVSHPDITRH